MKKGIGLIALLMVGWLLFFHNDSPKEGNDLEESLDLFGNYYVSAEKIMKNMSIEEKIGQLFLVRFDEDSVFEQIRKYHPGGYIFFAKDFKEETKESFSTKVSSYQEKSRQPLVIAVDEEGGIVTRVSRFLAFRDEKFASSQEIFAEGGYEKLAEIEAEKAKLLLSLGINLNLAPVADVSTNPEDYIYSRSFGKDAIKTSTYIRRMVEYANEQGISSSLKHFPGYGNNADTHTGISIDERDYDTFLTQDFLPFVAGIEASVPTILFSHNIVTSIDSKAPATLSKKVHEILRNELGFSGIIITDDLSMGAMKEYGASRSIPCLAIEAGSDLLITSEIDTMYQEVLEEVSSGKIEMGRIDMSVKRVIAWKLAYGLY